MDIFTSLQDNQHILVIGAGIFLYFQWHKKREEIARQLEEERVANRAQIEEVIRAALSNGIQTKMRELLREALIAHEKVEEAGLDRVMERFRSENTSAHAAIGQRISAVEQSTAVAGARVERLEQKWQDVLPPSPRQKRTES